MNNLSGLSARERALLHVAIRIAVMILIIIISKKYETVGNEFAASNPFSFRCCRSTITNPQKCPQTP